MSKRENIIAELTEIWYTLLNARTSYYYAEYLFEPPTPKEIDYMRHYGVELRFFSKVLWRNSVVEICKLFRKSEKRSIEKFLNKIDGGGIYSKEISEDLVSQWRLKLEGYQTIISKVMLMRDQVFAHSQKNYKDSAEEDNLDKDLEKLILLSESFISDIFLAFDAAAEHPPKLLRDGFNILEVLADYEEKRYKEIISRYKNIKE